MNSWRLTPSALLTLGFRCHTEIPALKELEEWFDVEPRKPERLDSYSRR